MAKKKAAKPGREDGCPKVPSAPDHSLPPKPSLSEPLQTGAEQVRTIQFFPRFTSGEDGRSIKFDQQLDLHSVQSLIEALGTSELDVMWHFLNQIAGSVPEAVPPADRLNQTLPLLHGLRPRDALDTMLLIQMLGIYNAIMECLRQAWHPKQVFQGMEAYLGHAGKLAKIFLSQLEAYRGKETKQQMVVKHVHVNQGGQAILGTVRHQGEGGGRHESD